MILKSSQLRAITTQDGAAILDTTLGKIATLNLTGSLVWQGLQRGEASEIIAANLAKETGEPLGEVQRDVDTFIEALRKEHLLSS